MNIFDEFLAHVVAALEGMTAAGALPEGLDFSNVKVEPPRDASHGDLSFLQAKARPAHSPRRRRSFAILLQE